MSLLILGTVIDLVLNWGYRRESHDLAAVDLFQQSKLYNGYVSPLRLF
jgi:hypothetical protein